MESARLQREQTNREPDTKKTRSTRQLSMKAPGLSFNDLAPPVFRLGAHLHDNAARTVQAKLNISRPGDRYEQEADHVADQVMRMPDPSLRLQRKCGCGGSSAAGESCGECGNRSVQLKRTATAGNSSAIAAPSSVHDVLRSPGRPLEASAREFMETRFSRDFNHVRVHTDAAAASSARQISALAYTAGHNVVFGPGQYSPHTNKGKALLAHELAHVVQQTSPGAGRPTIQRFTDFDSAAQSAGSSLGWVHPASNDLKISDDGQLAVEDMNWGHSTISWAAPEKIASANSILKSQSSKVKLNTGASKLTGSPPNSPKGKTKTLNEVVPVDAATGNPLSLTADCGDACQQVMGTAAGERNVAVMKGGGKETFTAGRVIAGGYGGAPDTTAPEEWSEEIFKKEFGTGLTRSEALRKYHELSVEKKKAFDEKYGINKFAVPEVGQGITTGTEFNMPGFRKHQKPGAIAGTMVDRNTWNYHFATTILTSGKDYVTVENATGSTRAFWVWMYGPASKKQSFDEFQAATLGHGTRQTTLVVEPEKLILGEINADDSPLLDDANKVTKVAKGNSIRVIQRPVARGANIFWRIRMTSGANIGLEGQMMQKFLKLIKT